MLSRRGQLTTISCSKTNATVWFSRRDVVEVCIKNKDVRLVGILKQKFLIRNLAIFKLLTTICGRIDEHSLRARHNTTKTW